MSQHQKNDPLKRTRRIVTGHDANGRSIFLSDGPSEFVRMNGMPNFVTTDLWKTDETPAAIESKRETCSLPVVTPPPEGGTLLRVVEFPPDSDLLPKLKTGEWMTQMRMQGFRAHISDSPRHPLMHSTSTIDYAIVLSGEIWALVDEGEKRMEAGDVLIQQGTNHAWSNRSGDSCMVAFVLIDAKPRSKDEAE